MAISTRKYYASMDNTELITEAQLRSAVKRINDRLYQLSKEGLKGSESWNQYANIANLFGGIQWHEGKKGTSREGQQIPSISVKNIKDIAKPIEQVTKRKYPSGEPLETKLVNSDKAKMILHYDIYGGTSAKDKKRAKAWLEENGFFAPTRKQIYEAVVTLGNLHQFIQDHSDSIYEVERVTGENIVHENSGKFSVDEVNRIMAIEKEKEELAKKNASGDSKPSEPQNENFVPLSWM